MTDTAHKTTPDSQQFRLRSLSLILELGKMARDAPDIEALGFVLVNETHLLTPYRQAILWQRNAPGQGEVVAISGLFRIDPQVPFVAWMRQLCGTLDRSSHAAEVRVIAPESLPETDQSAWAEWLPAELLWLPLNLPSGARPGGMLLAREAAWNQTDQELLAILAESYAHAWRALQPRRRLQFGPLPDIRRLPLLLLVAVLAGSLSLPIDMSVLAPAEVIPIDPVVVRSPQDGVIDQFLVRPNRTVKKGDLLLLLDDTNLRNRLDVARTDLESAQNEYRQEAQKAVLDQESKIRLALLQGRVEQRRTEVTHVEHLLERIRIRASRDGIALFEDVNDWLGRPVTVGERILVIADPDATELEIHLPVTDAIRLEPDAAVNFFSNSEPDQPLPAHLVESAFRPTSAPEGFLAYRLTARFAGEIAPPRIGLRGTARITGQEVSLFHYLLRRPLAALRRMTGI
ncbi:MAG: HlyD family efflux transporter periplasmic adaptor subunit [Magnetococcus sp. DMHC-1]|nr:HlyD family efflux transporter periplasmic adaptor subunit [Magnetococcales bacterium]